MHYYIAVRFKHLPIQYEFIELTTKCIMHCNYYYVYSLSEENYIVAKLKGERVTEQACYNFDNLVGSLR